MLAGQAPLAYVVSTLCLAKIYATFVRYTECNLAARLHDPVTSTGVGGEDLHPSALRRTFITIDPGTAAS
jgi:hypothetical protein